MIVCDRCGRKADPQGLQGVPCKVETVTVGIGGGTSTRGSGKGLPSADLCDPCREALAALALRFLTEQLPGAKGVGKP